MGLMHQPPDAPILFCGNNRVFGTTSANGIPVASATVFALENSPGFRQLRGTQSDATGGFVLDRLGSFTRVVMIAFDPTNQYDPTCKANLIPSPMPPDPSEHL